MQKEDLQEGLALVPEGKLQQALVPPNILAVLEETQLGPAAQAVAAAQVLTATERTVEILTVTKDRVVEQTAVVVMAEVQMLMAAAALDAAVQADKFQATALVVVREPEATLEAAAVWAMEAEEALAPMAVVEVEAMTTLAHGEVAMEVMVLNGMLHMAPAAAAEVEVKMALPVLWEETEASMAAVGAGALAPVLAVRAAVVSWLFITQQEILSLKIPSLIPVITQ